MKVLFIDAERSAYEPCEVRKTLTAGDLAELFSFFARNYGDDMKVYLRHDGGYTYGGITNEGLEIEEIDEEEE